MPTPAVTETIELLQVRVRAETPRLTRNVFMSGLQDTWNIASMQDGVMLLTVAPCRHPLPAERPSDCSAPTGRRFCSTGPVLPGAAPCARHRGRSGLRPGKAGRRCVHSPELAHTAAKPFVRLPLNADVASVANHTDIFEGIA